MKSEKFFEKHAWFVFIVVSGTGLIFATSLWFRPLSGFNIVSAFGHPVPESILADGASLQFLDFFFRWVGTILLGSNILTIFIAATAFRQGKRWAWLAFWYWPLMFGLHLIIYQGSFQISQVVWLILTISALVAMYGKAWQPPAGEIVAENQTLASRSL